MNIHAFISFQKTPIDDFTPFVELKIRNPSEKGNHIPFDILYVTTSGDIIELPIGANVIIMYKYSVPIKFWGSYINRSSTFFNEQLELKLTHSGEIDFKVFELQNYINGLEGNLVSVKSTDYSVENDFDICTGITTTTILLPKKRCGRWRIFWDAAKYFLHDVNSSYGRDLLRQTTY